MIPGCLTWKKKMPLKTVIWLFQNTGKPAATTVMYSNINICLGLNKKVRFKCFKVKCMRKRKTEDDTWLLHDSRWPWLEKTHFWLCKKLSPTTKRQCWFPGWHQFPVVYTQSNYNMKSVHHLSGNSILPSSEYCLYYTVSAYAKNNWPRAPSIGIFIKRKLQHNNHFFKNKMLQMTCRK